MTPEAHHLRLYVDGELSPEEVAAVEAAIAADPALEAAVRFERSLRNAVARSQQAQAAPADLTARVRAAIDSCEEVEPADLKIVETMADPAISPAAPGRNWWILRNPTRINYLAVAACLAIVGAAILFGIFGEPLVRQWQAGPEVSITTAIQQAIDDHNRCVYSALEQAARLTSNAPREIATLMFERLGRAAPLFDLTDVGYVVAGAGPCPLPPTPQESIHIMYRRANGEPGQVSVFIQPDHGQFETLLPGAAFHPPDFESCLERGASCAFRHDGFVYLLIACDAADAPDIERVVEEQVMTSDSTS